MKRLKIRFIEFNNWSGKLTYKIQVKKWYGWCTQGYAIDMGHGGVYNDYKNQDKESLLDEVLEKKFKTTRKFAKITEYPSLKKY